MGTPAQPDFLKTAAVGAVRLPFAPPQAGLGNIWHQNLTGLVQLGARVLDQVVQARAYSRHGVDVADRQVQPVVVALNIVIAHHPVKWRVTQFFDDRIHPVPAVVGIPYRHLVVLGVAAPLNE